MTSQYLLDANVFIDAHRRYYSFDIVPVFWETLCSHANDGKLISIDRVKQELVSSNKKDEDELSKWARSEFSPWFMSTDDTKVFASFGEIIEWANSQSQYSDSAKTEFADVADSWLIAYAKTYDCIIVTQEQLKPDVKARIPIPNACQDFNVTCIDTFELLRQLNARLG